MTGYSALTVLVVRIIQIILKVIADVNPTESFWPPVRDVENNTCFEYIIIGAGTAGSVLANRLTENPDVTVLLLEAGGDPQVEDLLPGLFFTEPKTDRDWSYAATFDPYAASAQNDHTVLQSGKMLGGSSTMNHLINVRGAQYDFDKIWTDIIGDDTWSYQNVLSYFKKSERLEDTEIEQSQFAPYHGYNGTQGLSREPRESADVYLESFNETGNQAVLDVNGDVNVGYTQSILYITEGIRQSSAYAFLNPIKNRTNLYVLRYTQATKINFDGTKAESVTAVKDNETYVYKACKEIIVSAGVYNTPQLLMLSGVGPKEHVESFGIDSIADLPVGQGLQDQVATSLVFKTAASASIPVIPPFTEAPFPIIIGLAALNSTQTYADYQVFSLVYQHDLPFILLTCAVIFPYRYDICDSFYSQSTGRNTLYNALTYTKPDSTGTVKLMSKDPLDRPEITTGYFTKTSDLDNMVEYVKDFVKVGNSSYFKEVEAELIDPKLKNCENYTFGINDEYLRCYILNTAFSVYHTAGTCAMGSSLDSRMRVLNVTNLRVVDASAMPNLTSGSPSAVVVMMAEKASDMIKEDSGNSSCSNTCTTE